MNMTGSAQILKRIEDHKPSGNIILGSIVRTDTANYFISIPAGEILAGNEKFYAVGIQAPIARQLIGKGKGDDFNLNGKTFKITEVI